MANLICVADGNLTSAATWATTDTTAVVEPTILGSTALTTSNQDSVAFAPTAITVDGVAIKLASRAAGSPTNTITVTLRDTTAGADKGSVTANVSDLAVCAVTDASGGWYFFKFAAPVALTGGNNHIVRVLLSATSTAVSLWTVSPTAANWLHMLRTTTTAAPVVGDNMHVMGEFNGSSNPATTSTHAVTMDQTAATDYGSAFVPASGDKSSSALSINNRATVTYGTSASTAYLLQLSGNCNVFAGGTLHIGASGAEIPRGSTAVLQFDCAAAGDFGLYIRSGGTFTAYGLSRTSGKNQWRCKLSADAAATNTVLNVDTDTGWLSGDDIGIAATTQTSTQTERRTLSLNASATQLTISAGLTNAHLGSGDYFAEIVLLTRSVEIRSTQSASKSTFFHAGPTASVACSWISFRYISTVTQPFQFETAAGGSLLFQYVVIQDTDSSVSSSGLANGGWTIDQTTIYNQRSTSTSLSIAQTTGTWTLTDLVVMGSAAVTAGLTFADVGGSIGNLTVCGCAGGGITWTEAAVESGNGPTFVSNPTWTSHSNGSSGGSGGFSIISTAHQRNITFPTLNIWRNFPRGIGVLAGCAMDNVEFTGTCLGNGPGTGEEPTGFWFGGGNPLNDVRFRSMTIASDSTYTSHWGILFDQRQTVANNIQFIDCVFSQTSGTRRQTSVADIGCIADVAPGTMCVNGVASNCSFNSAGTPISFYYASGPTPSRNSKYSGIRCPMFGQVAGVHRTYTPRGTFLIEQSVVDVAPSLQIQPLEGLATPIDSNAFQAGWGFLVPVLSGQTVTVSVLVEINGSYNGSTNPQLVVLANEQLGFAADAVLATHSGSSGSFQLLSGTTAAAGADGVMEFVVRSYGTAGAVYLDTWKAA